MSRFKRLAAVAIVVCGFALLGGYAGFSAGRPSALAAGQSTLQAARATGRIRVGYANEAPYAYMESKKNKVTGESVEIARVVLKRMGIDKIDVVLTEFGSLIPGLRAQRFDIIAAGMYVTPERCRQVAFSNPTYGVGQAFLVAKGNPRQLHAYEDVARKPDAKLGVVVGAIEADYAAKLNIPQDRLVIFPDAVSALDGVQAGRADAYGATSLTINHLLGKLDADSGLEKAAPFTDPVIDGKGVRGYGAYAFRPEDKDFAEAFNTELARFIGTEEHRKLVAPFGFTPQELPNGMTAARLCAGQ